MKSCTAAGSHRASKRAQAGTPVCCWMWILTLGLLIGWTPWAEPASAQQQHLAERYQAARLQLKADQLLEQRDGPFLPPLPALRLPVAADSLRPDSSPESDSTQSEASFRVTDRRVVRKLERSWFQHKFGDSQWAFLGASRYITLLDTTLTRELRARLQAQFGDPTQTIADFQPERRPDDLLQFEYWFVVNDSIPVRVTDVNGPNERGLIMATDQRYRDRLAEVRGAVLKPLMEAGERAPYVDYYYDWQGDAWYRVGFDGTRFFVESIRRRDVTPGRRPWLDAASTQDTPRR